MAHGKAGPRVASVNTSEEERASRTQIPVDNTSSMTVCQEKGTGMLACLVEREFLEASRAGGVDASVSARRTGKQEVKCGERWETQVDIRIGEPFHTLKLGTVDAGAGAGKAWSCLYLQDMYVRWLTKMGQVPLSSAKLVGCAQTLPSVWSC